MTWEGRYRCDVEGCGLGEVTWERASSGPRSLAMKDAVVQTINHHRGQHGQPWLLHVGERAA